LRLGLEFGFIFPRVDAINGADVDACGVLRSDTGLSDYVRHRDSPSGDIDSLKNKNHLAFAWKVSVYIIKPATPQASFCSQKVYHVWIGVSLPRILDLLARLSGAVMHRNCRPELHERLRLSRGDVGADDFQIFEGGFESLFCVMLGYKAGVVVKSRIPLPPEPVEHDDYTGMFFVNPCPDEFDNRDMMAKLASCAKTVAKHEAQGSL